MDQITEKIWIGDAHDGLDVPGVKTREITAILAVLREYIGNADWAQAGILRIQIPLDDGMPGQKELLGQAVMTLDRLIKEGHKVLVHCGAGISRSSTTVIGYLIYSKQFTDWDKAEALVRFKRPIIFPHGTLRRSMKRWLKMWPYDGTYKLPETEELMDTE